MSSTLQITTHQQLTEAEQRQSGVLPEMVRLSIGTENAEDIINDLNDALSIFHKQTVTT